MKVYGTNGSNDIAPVYGRGGIMQTVDYYADYSKESHIPFKLRSGSLKAITGEDATFVRATSATVIDHDNVVRTANSGEVRFPNLRRVENLIEDSEDFSNASWGNNANMSLTHSISDPFGGTKASTITADANNAVFGDVLTGVSGNSYVGSSWIRRRTGTGSLILKIAENAGVDISASITSEWKRLSREDDATSTALRYYFEVGTSGDEFDISHAMLQDKTGASDSTIPDGYVSKGVLSDPWQGAGVDGVKVFDTTNANTVASNVVTHVTGTAITDGIGVLTEPAETNVCLQNRDFDTTWTAVGGTMSSAQDITGIDGKPNTAWTLGDTDAGAQTRRNQDITISNDSNRHYSKIYILKDTDTTRFPEIGFACNGGTTQIISVQVNTQTGATSQRDNIGTNGFSISQVTLSGNDWWELIMYIENNTSGNTNLYLQIFPAITDTIGTVDATITGTIGVDAPQVALNATHIGSNIFTTTASVTRNADVLTYPTDYIPVNDCMFKVDWTPSTDNAGTQYLFSSTSDASNRLILIAHNSGSIRFYKIVGGATTIYAHEVYTAGNAITIKCRLLNGEPDVWVENVKGTQNAVSSSDAVLGTTIGIGYSQASPSTEQQTGAINNFKVYQGQFTDAEVVDL